MPLLKTLNTTESQLRLRTFIGLWLIWLAFPVALLNACWGRERLVTHPLALLPFALWLLCPHRSVMLQKLQQIILFQFLAILIWASFPVFWSIGGENIRLSGSIFLLLTAFLGRSLIPVRENDEWLREMDIWPIALAVAILALHVLLLAGLLSRSYGYPWEQVRQWAARVGILVMMMVLIQPVANSLRMRQCSGALFALALLWSRLV